MGGESSVMTTPVQRAGQATADEAVARAIEQAQAAERAAEQAAERAQRDAERAIRDAQRQVDQATREGQTVQPPWAGEFPPGGSPIPQEAVLISVAFFVMCAVIAIGVPIVRALARRMDRKAVAAPGADSDTRMRLERIEHAVDAIAVEVERISEGQRYSTKVLAGLRALPESEPDPAQPQAAPMARARERR